MDKKEYTAIHKWLRDNYGKANHCEQCSNPAKRFDWALKKNCNYEKNKNSFIQLCRSCHLKYDFTQDRKNKIAFSQTGINNNFFGREFTEEMKIKQRAKKISKPIKAFNVETKEEREFISIAETWKQLNLKKSNIIAFLKGRYNGKTYKNWEFTYC